MENTRGNLFKRGILLVSLLLVYVGNSWGVERTFAIDFENAAETYTNWIFTNILTQQTSANVTAHGGSYFGTTNGQLNASITTKEKIALPKSITFYVTKTNTTVNSSSWIIQTSVDNYNWTDILTSAAATMDRGKWVNITQSLTDKNDVYIRILYSGNTNIRAIDDVTLTYDDGNENVTKHTVTWSVNGNTSTEEIAEGEQIAFVTPASNIPEGKVFVGWTTSRIYGIQNTSPTYTTSATMGTSDVTYYAVFATKTGGNPTWSKITNAEDVTDGVYAIISYEESSYLPNKVTTSCPTRIHTTTTNSVIDVLDDMKWNLTISSGVVNLESAAASGAYLWGGSANDATSVQAENTKTGRTKDWHIGTLTGYGIVLYNNAEEANRYLATYSTNDWRNYYDTSCSDVNRPANLYKLIGGITYTDYCTETNGETLTITLNAACTDGALIYGTYSNSEKAFVVPEDLTVTEISVTDGKISVAPYSTGDIVPKNTGVMVSAATGGDYSVYVADGGSSVLGENNYLKASGNNGLTAEEMATTTPNCLYYRLTMHNGTQIGYWWGAEDGAAFAIAGNKAYLAVPAEQEIKGGNWIDGDMDCIDNLRANDESKLLYNISGQRIDNPIKGHLYIMNGHKYLFKK